MLNAHVITPLSPAELANSRIRALVSGARGRALTPTERERYALLLDEYHSARQAESQERVREIAAAA
ncbi:hypothetical protein [Streptacidiphilus jiangxiensis]|uniref:Uncharacterized protein n=1 Tax=Streptacidiphilus jiangxiensis TaxID=235985 RepID=A0A1H7L8U1_STRJI|nr:hypothetical protein [Streptacidiphilus jiangxiensis]SEK95371.1 hypothetical protein SAMN05414137_104398 [Streptacidiphilus jiangxiensis]